MSEKLCVQWNDFKRDINSIFGKLRNDREFTDITLVCEDGQQMEAHKVIMAASSPFFEKILQKSKHPHPLIYLRGFQSKDFASILDFLYFGEANVYQEYLDPFLAIAEGIKLKGLTGQTSSELFEEQDKSRHFEPTKISNEVSKTPSSDQALIKPTAIAIPNLSGTTNLSALDEKVKSMMEKGQRMIPHGKQANGTRKQATSCICKVCGKEGRGTYIRNHIESNHLEGISLPCDCCGKSLSSRASLAVHKSRYCVATRANENQ